MVLRHVTSSPLMFNGFAGNCCNPLRLTGIMVATALEIAFFPIDHVCFAGEMLALIVFIVSNQIVPSNPHYKQYPPEIEGLGQLILLIRTVHCYACTNHIHNPIQLMASSKSQLLNFIKMLTIKSHDRSRPNVMCTQIIMQKAFQCGINTRVMII